MVSKAKWIRNIFVVWMLTGLWHGAAWNFILWGFYYGVILLIEKLYLYRKLEKLPRIFCHIYTLLIVMIGWMIFRSNSLSDILVFINEMFIYKQTDWVYILSDNLITFNALLFMFPGIILSFPVIKILREKKKNNSIYILGEDIMLLALFVICILYLTSSSYNPFIYFRF